MTEPEWLACTDPPAVLAFLRAKLSTRKVRSFVCACARTLWTQFPEKLLRDSVETAERYAAELADQKDLEHADSALWGRALRVTNLAQGSWGISFALAMAAVLPSHRLTTGLSWEYACLPVVSQQLPLARCIFGDPFHPVGIDPTWLSPTVVQLAKAAYNERQLPGGTLDLNCLAVLAGALEE